MEGPLNNHSSNFNENISNKIFTNGSIKNANKDCNSNLYRPDPKGGIGIFVIDPTNTKVLIGRRKDNGLFAQPGGWLELGEEWEECGARELREETGLNVDPTRIHHIKTFNCYDPKNNYHNVAIYLYLQLKDNELKDIKTCEPDKCENWEWVDFTFLRDNFNKFFFPVQVFLLKEANIILAADLRKLVK